MNIQAYLRRINYQGSLTPTAQMLRDLHVAHQLTVPFENLSISLGQPIILDEGALYAKIVERQRGGFCYELNGLFAALLRELGFRVTMLSAGVAHPAGAFGPEFDHMALMVSLEWRWLADVGFGDAFREPLLLDEPGEQRQNGRAYRIVPDDPYRTLLRRDDGGDWRARYRFTLKPHEMADYQGMCLFHQTSPQSPFTRRRTCSLATPDGRITLTDMRLIRTGPNGVCQERLLTSEDEYESLLRTQFGILLP
jgi:N-hydroxyarylamine O-acetyltransferase